MGYRGTMEEYAKDELVACNIAGVMIERGITGVNLLMLPNGFYTTLKVNDMEIDLLKQHPNKHKQILDIRDGLHVRKTEYDTKYGKVNISAERFVSLLIYILCA